MRRTGWHRTPDGLWVPARHLLFSDEFVPRNRTFGPSGTGAAIPPPAVGSWLDANAAAGGSGTQAAPWNSLQTAINNQTNWDSRTLNIVGDGRIYATPLQLNTSGASGNPYLVRGSYTTTRPVIRPNGATRSFFVGAKSWLNFTGLTFDGVNQDANWDVAKVSEAGGSPSTDIVFTSCEFKNGHNTSGNPGGQGMLIAASLRITFAGCSAHDNGSVGNLIHGFYVSQSENITFTDCEAYSNSCVGFHVYADVPNTNDNVVLERCRAYNNARTAAGAGILMCAGTGQRVINCQAWGQQRGFECGWEGSPGLKLYHCVAYNNSQYGFFVEFGSGIERKNCIAYGNGTNVSWPAPSPIQSGNLDGTNPGWVNPGSGDFHLSSAGSPAIGIGSDVGVPTDYYGNPRVGAPDAGVHEWQG